MQMEKKEKEALIEEILVAVQERLLKKRKFKKIAGKMIREIIREELADINKEKEDAS